MKKLSSKIYMYALFTFLYLPILVLIVFSFNASKSMARWTGFTFDWYIKLFQDEAIMSALLNTVIVAVAASVLSTILGTMAALGIHSMKKTSKSVIMGVTYIPVINPEIIMGVSLMLLFKFFVDSFGFRFGFVSLVLAHISFDVPYVIYNVLPKLRSMNPNLVEAAKDLGCNSKKAFFKVVIPEIMPGIFSGFLMALTYSIDDFVISYFTSGIKVQTLSIAIEAMTRKKINPEINALSAIIFVVISAILITKNILENRKLRRERAQFRAAQRKESAI